MALSNAQLLLLNNLIYVDNGYLESGGTVKDIINRMEIDNFQLMKNPETGKYPCEMDYQEWKTLVTSIKNDSTLLDYKITEYRNESTGMRAACFVDDVNNPKDVNIVFRGTGNAYEWRDNGKGGYVSETEQQLRAAKYVEDLPSEWGDAMTVTGHSKGGNKAQFVTIATNRIAKCVSYDGQGFSKEFLEDPKYKDAIRKKANSIISISASDDFVNCLLYPIAGTRIYLKTETQDNFGYYHKPNILLDANGNLMPEGEQSDLSKLINEYTTYMISSLPEPERSATIDGLIEVVIAILNGEGEKQAIWDNLYSEVIAISHVDDFAFNYIGETYGFPARLGATYIAAVACPYLFLDDLLDCGKDMVGNVLNSMFSLANVINERLISFGEKAKAFGEKFVKGISSFASSVKESYNMLFNKGYQYASSNTFFEVNTATLRGYADRLDKVNGRVVDLDRRMDSLYKKVGLRDLLKLLKADLMTGYNWHISNCSKYLNETANDFDKVERDISSQY